MTEEHDNQAEEMPASAPILEGTAGVDPSINAGREAFGDVSDFGSQEEDEATDGDDDERQAE